MEKSASTVATLHPRNTRSAGSVLSGPIHAARSITANIKTIEHAFILPSCEKYLKSGSELVNLNLTAYQ